MARWVRATAPTFIISNRKLTMRLVISLDDASVLTTKAEQVIDVRIDMLLHCGDVFATVTEVQPHALMTMPACDVAVIDFGGLGIGVSDLRARQAASYLARLVDERPSTVFCIWSAHTESWYRDAIHRELADTSTGKATLPPNVLLYSNNDNFWDALRAQLHIPEPQLHDSKVDALYAQLEALRAAAGHNEEGEPAPPPKRVTREPKAKKPKAKKSKTAAVPGAPAPLVRRNQLEPWAMPMQEFDTEREPDGGLTYGDVLGHISLPVRLRLRPGQTHGGMAFKFADCMVSLESGDREIASFGGTLAGAYEITVNDVGPDGTQSLTVFLTATEIWNAFDKFRLEFMQQHPEYVPDEFKAQSGLQSLA